MLSLDFLPVISLGLINQNKKLVIVNTVKSDYDSYAELVIYSKFEDFFPVLWDKLNEKKQPEIV